MAEQNVSKLIGEIKSRLDLLSHSLPKVVDPASDPILPKVAYKYLVYRETLIWRAEELGRASLSEFRSNRLVSAILLTRGLIETTAAIGYVSNTIQETINSNSISNLDNKAMRLIMGARWEDWDHPSINILTMVDCVNKEYPNFRDLYNSMSEFAHPNWSGTGYTYSKHDHEKIYTELGKYMRSEDSLNHQLLNSLCISLYIFERYYNCLSDNFLDFSEICRREFEDY